MYDMPGMSTNTVKRKAKTIVIAEKPDRTGIMLWSGILRYAGEKANWKTISLATYQCKKPISEFCSDIRSIHIDGLIVGHHLRHRVLSALSNQPHVKIVTTEPMNSVGILPCCVIDNAAIGKSAANLLIQRGFTNFCYVKVEAPDEKSHSDLRWESFEKTLVESGFSCTPLSFDKSLPSALAKLPRPLGVFAYNDRLAPLVINACAQAKMSIPEEVGIVGVDNDVNICECLRPSLSSITADFEAGGYEAARLLDDLMHGRKRGTPTVLYGSAAVVERDSTRDLKAGGLIVSRATEIIRKHFREELTVETIARQLHVSSVLLHRRFKEVLGQTVHSLIEKARLDHAANQLIRTTLTVAEISRESGFPCVEHFHRLFKERFGSTPKSWRDKHNR